MSLIEKLHEKAVLSADKSGISTDFGDTDYLPALELLCSDMHNDHRVPKGTAAALEQMCVGSLLGRLYSEHYWREFPQHNSIELKQAIFIVGLPRSGTTALQKLLTADTANQGLEYWLGQTPQPRPPKDQWPSIPEYQHCAASLDFLNDIAPEMMRIHRMRADEADECRLLLMQDFANVTFQSNADLPNYEDWVYRSDFDMAYQRYRKNLQLIGMHHPDNRWVLKDPSHLWAPQTLYRYFPDACIVQLHRAPQQLIPSVCSLVYQSRRLSDPEANPNQVGARELNQWSRVLSNFTELRKTRPDMNVFDISMHELQRHPLRVVGNIYKHFGIPFPEQNQKALADWQLTQGESKKSLHSYKCEDFGLSTDQINERFTDYIDSYGAYF